MVESKLMPKVTVILPSYNHEKYIKEAINSVLNQTYKNIELIVIDDCSSDNSVSIIREMTQSNDFVFIEHSTNMGTQYTVQEAIRLGTGEYLQLFASDDILIDNKFEVQIEYLSNSNLDGLLSSSIILHPNGEETISDMKKILKMFENNEILKHTYVNDSSGALLQSGLFKLNIFKQINDIRSDIKSDDWAVLIKLLEGYNIGFLDLPLIKYRLHETNSHKDLWSTFPMRVEVISKLTPEYLRDKGMANLMESMASYLFTKKKYKLGIKFYISSLVLDLRFSRAKKLGSYFLRKLTNR